MIVLDLCVLIIITLVTFNFKSLFRDFTRKERNSLNKLFFFHFAIAIFFHWYISSNGGDAQHYWEYPAVLEFSEVLAQVSQRYGTPWMYLINYVPANTLQLSFFTGNMIYACIGFIGFVLLFRICKKYLTDEGDLSAIRLFNIPVFPYLFFLPNFHFWSSGIGKDTLMFTAVILFLFAMIKFKRRWSLLLIASLLILIVRPHILMFLVVSFGIAFLFDGRGLKGYQKLVLLFVFIGGFVFLLDFVLQFVQIENLETETISQYASDKSSSLNRADTGSSIDTSQYSIPMKIFTFLYRPFFFDSNGILGLLASVENLVLLLFSVSFLIKKPLKAWKEAPYILKSSFLFFLFGAIAFSMILGNLGIMLRQKNMFMPWLIVFGLWCSYYAISKNKPNESTHPH
ncbi:hypothetical protein [Altibacter sp. HG106]|uniref:hypothetical protein n=1 Tax=Altibacter sp. HG106 TaxID=3023937 RepID=UPI0023508DE1|nr:hypothetical protein [Altibacter sp. HG106]MDC7995359.1 hypothetical protein [Altibacter sp. HG106]